MKMSTRTKVTFVVAAIIYGIMGFSLPVWFVRSPLFLLFLLFCALSGAIIGIYRAQADITKEKQNESFHA